MSQAVRSWEARLQYRVIQVLASGSPGISVFAIPVCTLIMMIIFQHVPESMYWYRLIFLMLFECYHPPLDGCTASVITV